MKLVQLFWQNKLAAMALALAGSIAAGIGQTYPNFIADQFDATINIPTNNFPVYGTTVPVITWDTNNAITTMGPNHPGSGSLKCQINWVTPSGDQVIIARWFTNSTILNLNHYTNMTFDLMFPATCGTDGAGSYGDVEAGCIPAADGWPSLALGVYPSEVTNGNGWIHVSIPINGGSNPKFSSVEGYYIKIQQSRTGGNLTNTTFYLDNVTYGGLKVQSPPPKLSIAANTNPPGLMVVCGGSGGSYTRGLMMAFDAANGTRNFSWVGTASPTTPVTYSQTIVSYPGTNTFTAGNSVQSAIFLVQNGQYGDPGIDYDAANVAELSMYGNTDGTATATFAYKTNQADGNSQYATNVIATLTAPSPLGTWGVTFLNDINVTLTYVPLGGGPGLSTNGNFPSDSLVRTYFANPLSVYMGNQQNGGANVGQSTTYSQFLISGVTASPSISENWTNQLTLDTNNWGIVDYAPDDILLVHAADEYWVNWTPPDSGFTMEISTNLAGGSWQDISPQVVTTTAGNRALLPGLVTNFPTGNDAFIDLVKRTTSLLQVLPPGETNGAGTTTGTMAQ